jgi:hypothetical protein
LDRLAKARTVPRAGVSRRFVRGWRNFETTYKPLAEAWAMYDDSGSAPQVTGDQTMKTTNGKKPTKTFAAIVGRALPRAGQTARKTAPAHGTQPWIIRCTFSKRLTATWPNRQISRSSDVLPLLLVIETARRRLPPRIPQEAMSSDQLCAAFAHLRVPKIRKLLQQAQPKVLEIARRGSKNWGFEL